MFVSVCADLCSCMRGVSRCTSFDSSEMEGLSGEEGEVTVAAGLEAVWTEGDIRLQEAQDRVLVCSHLCREAL